MLRIFSDLAGEQVAEYVAKLHGRARKLDVTFQVATLLANLGLPEDMEPKDAMRWHLIPAAAEISEHTGYKVSVREQRVRYKPGPHAGKEGLLTGFIITIDVPVNDTPVAYPAARKPGEAWKPAPKYSKPAKPPVLPPAFIDNVAILPDDDDDDDVFLREPNPSGPKPIYPVGTPGAGFGGFAAMRGKR